MTLPAPLLSCGLLVINERGELLVGHSTGSPLGPPRASSMPAKPRSSARREGQEEFGLAFAPTRLVDLGRFAYYRGKDLHPFAVRTTTAETRPGTLPLHQPLRGHPPAARCAPKSTPTPGPTTTPSDASSARACAACSSTRTCWRWRKGRWGCEGNPLGDRQFHDHQQLHQALK